MMSDQENNVEARNNKCKFKIYSKRDRNPVFITEFTNGRVSSEGAKNLQFQYSKSANDSQCLSATNGRLNYTGLSTNDPNTPLSYFVGVRNKNTGKMKLYDANYFRMKPNINVRADPTTVSVDKRDYRETMDALSENFGSKARKRAMASSRNNAVDSTSLDFSSFLAENEFVEPQTNSKNGQVDYLPPVNKEASNPSEVFDISSIISPSIDSALDVKVALLLSASNEEIVDIKSRFCSYVNSHFDLGDIDNLCSKYLIYYNYLVIFQQLKYAAIRRRIPTPNIPEPFLSFILKNFTMTSAKNSRTIPQTCKDKLLAHILVLALFIDHFNVNLHSLTNDLSNAKLDKLITICHALGCHVSTVTSSDGEKLKFAVLKLPLYISSVKPSRRPK